MQVKYLAMVFGQDRKENRVINVWDENLEFSNNMYMYPHLL